MRFAQMGSLMDTRWWIGIGILLILDILVLVAVAQSYHH